MALFDLLGRRWAMGVIWTLHPGPLTFRALQRLCEKKSGAISPSILNTRIKDLQEAQLLSRTLAGYQLTVLGQEVFTLLEPLGAWSKKWERELAKREHREK
jgi:DNA-binding HxlR family transcriptional regulator